MKDKIINSFSTSLKELIDDIIIKNKKVFVTLKAENSYQARELEDLKTECENKISDFNLFDEINVTFTKIKRKFSGKSPISLSGPIVPNLFSSKE